MPTINHLQKTIYYEQRGRGCPVILIHGVGLDHNMWEKQVQVLDNYFKVITYDMLGHGRSEKLSTPCNLSDFVDQINVLINFLALESVHIVGFSMGGMVAQAFAIEHPDKVETLTVMNAVANRTTNQRNAILSRVQEVELKGHTATIEPAIRRWFNKEFIDQHPEEVQQIRKRLQDNDSTSYLQAYRVFATADAELFPKIDQIECQTLILTGEYDVGSTPTMAKEMSNRIPNSRVSVVSGMKHMMPLEDYKTVNKELLSFIRKYNAIQSC